MNIINKSFSINYFFNKNLKRIIAGKSENLFCRDLIRDCICLHLDFINEKEYYCLNNIWYGSKETESGIKVFDFWINNKNITLGEFWLENFETDWSYMLLMHKYNITISMAQSAVHCISCILAGYQCSIDLNSIIPQWRKVWASNFNLYLSRRYKYIGYSDLWNEQVAVQRFCFQFPDTEYNRNTIFYFNYDNVVTPNFQKYGLKLKYTNLLLSEILFSYIDLSIYKKVKNVKKYVSGKGYINVSLSFNEFKNAIYLIYTLINDYNFMI